jgi:hypothetical protein
MATSKIQSIVHTSNWTAPDGTTYYYHKIVMENGDAGNGALKSLTELSVGQSIEYEITNDKLRVLKSTFMKEAPKQSAPAKAPRNYGSNGKRSPEDYLGFIYGYAKDIHIAEMHATGKKVPLANLKKNVEEMYAHIQELLLNN